MGDVIDVDFAALRRAREQAVPQVSKPIMNHAQACMLQTSALKLSDAEQTELLAALSDYDCYMQACEHIQLLVDIYQMLEAF
jgi:uncharacterized protein (DUF1778 family)